MNNLTLADLETFDPAAPQRAGERRFLCPSCGHDKPRDAAHRSLCLNSSSGLYQCKRCGCKGRLQEFWPEQTQANRAQIATQKLRQSFEITPVAHNASTSSESTDWIELWEGSQPLGQGRSHGAALRYLLRRGISLECARENEVRLVANWYHRPTLGFPFKDERGAVVALSGRALRDGGLDKPASGPKKSGAFWAGALGFSPFAVALPAVVLCEAPFDALSLAMAGYPAIALGGTAAPIWLHQKCAFRRVLLAFDADDAGDNAALKIGAHLKSFGATCFRLRPANAKDWNELLQNGGTEAVEALVAPVVSQLG